MVLLILNDSQTLLIKVLKNNNWNDNFNINRKYPFFNQISYLEINVLLKDHCLLCFFLKQIWTKKHVIVYFLMKESNTLSWVTSNHSCEITGFFHHKKAEYEIVQV